MSKQRAEYLQKQDENKAKARALYKANQNASVSDSCKADPEKMASVRDNYKADLEKKASVRDTYKAQRPIPKRRRPLYATVQRRY